MNIDALIHLIKKTQFSVIIKPGTRRPHAWFLKIDPVQIVSMHVCVCVCVCVSSPMTSGVMWHDMDLIRLVNPLYPKPIENEPKMWPNICHFFKFTKYEISGYL